MTKRTELSLQGRQRKMSEETTVRARLREDGTVVQILSDGSEVALEHQTDWERVDVRR